MVSGIEGDCTFRSTELGIVRFLVKLNGIGLGFGLTGEDVCVN